METHKDAAHLHLVLDNLNTHKEKALRACFGDERSAAFFAHVTLHFTPYHASWLNMAELEINCHKTQGLKQRIATHESLCSTTITAIVKERNGRTATIQWGFTKEKAQKKFPVLYGIN